MIKRLVDYVSRTVPGSGPPLTLQDLALCLTWLEHPARDACPEFIGALRARVDAWRAQGGPNEFNTAGRRHESLLRDLLSLVERHGTESLNGDELSFLTMYGRLTRDRPDSRAKALLERWMPGLEARPRSGAVSPGLVALERHIQYASSDDIGAAPVSLIRLLAGVELPCRGPVFKASATLRVLGDVPDECTVVVENGGACGVDGYVMGRVLSRGQCEIRHNISGVAMVLTGSIRARGIINSATAISKLGDVTCVNAQGPRLVFGGQSITVMEHAMLGRYVTRAMRVGGEARGARIEVAESAVASCFRTLGMCQSSVVLRRELTCADYGEVTGPELNQLLSRAHGLRRRARNFDSLATAARGEADHNAQSLLMFIFGGGEVQKHLESLLRAQRRHAFVTHVLQNLRSILNEASDALYHGAPTGEGTETSAQTDQLPELEDGEDEELRAARAETQSLAQSLSERALDRGQTTMLLESARQKLAAMQRLEARMAEEVAREERAIQRIEKYEQILAGGSAQATKLDVLYRILPALQSQPAESAIGKRLRAPFAVRALRTVGRAVARANEFDKRVEEHLADFRSVADRLGRDYQIRVLEDPEAAQCVARVTGRFESGCRIFMETYFENLADAPPESVITTGGDDEVHTYVRGSSAPRFHTAD